MGELLEEVQAAFPEAYILKTDTPIEYTPWYVPDCIAIEFDGTTIAYRIDRWTTSEQIINGIRHTVKKFTSRSNNV